MKVTQEKLPASRLGLEIEVPAELSKQIYDQTVDKLARQVNIPGFRKGKAPRQILMQSLGRTRIKASAIEDLVQKGIEEAIRQEKIDALGNYQLQSSFEDLIESFEPGQPLVFSASVDIPPTPTLKTYQGLTLQAEEIQYKAEQVNEVLSKHQKQMATLVPVEDRAAQMDDVVIVDFEGVLELPADAAEGQTPEPIPGGSGTGMQVELSEGRFIPGFIEGIVGMTPGETRSVAAQFPESYAEESVAGRAATFTITLQEIKSRELPELNDDFAQEISDFDTLAELREMLEKRYQDEATNKTKANKHAAFFKALVDQIEVDLPETLIQQEVKTILMQLVNNLSEQGVDVNRILNQETVKSFQQEMRPEAMVRLKRSLIIQEVAKQESLSVPEDELQAKVDDVLRNATNTEGVDPERLKLVVHEDLLKDKVMEWLEAHNALELVAEGSLAQANEAEATDRLEIAPSDKDAALETLDVEAVDVSAEASATDASASEPALASVEVTPESDAAPAKSSAGKGTKAASKSSSAKTKATKNVDPDSNASTTETSEDPQAPSSTQPSKAKKSKAK